MCCLSTNNNVSNPDYIFYRMITNAELGDLWQGVFLGYIGNSVVSMSERLILLF